MAADGAKPVRIAVIGAGAVSDYHHVPAIRQDPRAELVLVCDASEAMARQRAEQWHLDRVSMNYQEVCAADDVDAVIIATPNSTHAAIAMAALQNGKHVLCEKPLGLSADQAGQMYRAAKAAGVVHMTAFTYRFAPSMRFMGELLRTGRLGEPRHFRSQRFLDWPETSWGWRQYRDRAGAGNLYDMTIHRIDLGLWLMGNITELTGMTAQFTPRDKTSDGRKCKPSEVDDWTSLIARFENGAVGVWEGTTLAKGYGRFGFGHDWCEINGSEGTAVYQLHRPNEIWLGKSGQDLMPHPVPEPFLKPDDSPRNPDEGAPATVFRYDLVWEFVSAIVNGRSAQPDFYDGWYAQIVADAVRQSESERRWIPIKPPSR